MQNEERSKRRERALREAFPQYPWDENWNPVEAMFSRKLPSLADPDGRGAERLGEILATVRPEERPFLAAIAAMTYEDYLDLTTPLKPRGRRPGAAAGPAAEASPATDRSDSDQTAGGCT